VPWLLDRLSDAADEGSERSTTVELNWRALVIGVLLSWLVAGLAFRGAMCLWGGW